MARKFLTHLDLGKNELQNAVVQVLAGAPSSPSKGQIYFNDTDKTMWWYNGTSWVSAAGGGTGFPGYGSPTQETTFGVGGANGSSALVARADHTHGNPTHVAADHSTIPVNSLAAATGALDMGNQRINNIFAPLNANDAATKSYVDSFSQGLDVKPSVRCASTGNLTLSGLQTVDGVTLTNLERVLVKDQSTPAQNGIYTANAGAWSRAVDMDVWTEFPGAFCFVEEGTTQKDTGWTCTSDTGGTLNTTAVTWAQFSSAGAVVAGNGLTQSGQTINVVTDGSLTAAADLLSVNFAGTGAAVTAAKSDHTHTASTTRYATDVGSGTAVTVAHNLNTRDVTVEVYRNTTPWDTIDCDVERGTVNNVTLRFTVAPAAGDYRVVVAA